MSRNLPANPLHALVARAASALPETTGATREWQRRTGGAGRAILLDVSSSMSDVVNGRRKIDHLRRALAAARQGGETLWAFSGETVRIDSPEGIPEPSGQTALGRALRAVGAARPAYTLVITDGEPDSEADALAAAAEITGRIDTLYCGPEGNRRALDFLFRLARSTGGRASGYSWNAPREIEISHMIRALLIEAPRQDSA